MMKRVTRSQARTAGAASASSAHDGADSTRSRISTAAKAVHNAAGPSSSTHSSAAAPPPPLSDASSDSDDGYVSPKKSRRGTGKAGADKRRNKSGAGERRSNKAAGKKCQRRRDNDAARRSAAAHAESDSDQWEEVAGQQEAEAATLSGNLEITVKRPQTDIEKYIGAELKREINRYRKGLRAELHKVQLLCYIGHLIGASKLANDALVRAVALSIVPGGYAHSPPSDKAALAKFASWFCHAHALATAARHSKVRRDCALTVESVVHAFQSKVCWSTLQISLMFVSALRALGVPARLAVSAQPAPLKLEAPADRATAAHTTSKGKKSPDDVSKAAGKAGGSKEQSTAPGSRSSPDAPQSTSTHYWAEVYADADETWIVADPARLCDSNEVVGVEQQLADACSRTAPVHYALVVDDEQGVRDVTVRYTGSLTHAVQRLRTDSAWWHETLGIFAPFEHPLRNRLEDMQLKDRAEAAPLPKTVNEYKNHPLYALRRHLLKFEAIYPADAAVVGAVRGEPVYSRSSVATLHAKEAWIKQARTILDGAEPYKIVKARPKQGIAKSEQRDRPLPLFGMWQTKEYVPLSVVDGKVPRNEFGNLELYDVGKMLPAGCVHVDVPRAHEVARSLDMDAVPALVAWDVHGGRSHPVLHGVVVLRHCEKVLRDACHQHLAAIRQKEIDMKQTRAYANWKKLVRFVIRKENMRRLFGKEKHGRQRAGTSARGGETLEESLSDNEAADAQKHAAAAWPQCREQFTL